MMDLFKKLQGLFGGDNSAEAIEKQMQKMQEQMGGMPGMGDIKMPKGMENIDLNNLDFSKGKKK